MLLLTLEDMNETLNAIVFPEVDRLTKSILNLNAPVLVTVVIEMDTERGEPFLRVEKVVSIK
jgi:hypothetical protein